MQSFALFHKALPRVFRCSSRNHPTLAVGQFVLLTFSIVTCLHAGDDRQAIHRGTSQVWSPHQEFPKLVTPQWVGDDGVECVVTLAIDDMRDTSKYEAYLRPILQRLKLIDGRAPVSIMTCSVKPDDAQLQSWLQEGLSLECHTFDHPCPLLAAGDLQKSKGTYDKCVDLLNSIPNNAPVAFRTPCCDSLNTVSPRFYSEIFNRKTPNGNFLQLDSSVFILYTADDPSIPREWLFDSDGKEKFRKYIPRRLTRGNLVHDGFLNTIENYPYPYLINNLCWQFPCMVPSDWSANYYHKPNNPDTVRDLKVALDITVHKQGVFNLVFHPHGWIKPEQVIELIDHAVASHGTKVKFLTFRECVDRLNKNLLVGDSIRNSADQTRTSIMDVDRDGYLDVISTKENGTRVRVWDQRARRWNDGNAPQVQQAVALMKGPDDSQRLPELPAVIKGRISTTSPALCFVDLNDDGHLDLILSSTQESGCWLQDAESKSCSIELFHAKREEKNSAAISLPPFVREDGSDNGFFVKDRHLCWINEDTDGLPDFVTRVAFDRLMGDRLPAAKSPDAAIQSMRVTPGYRVELVAHEPLTMDPIALDWGPDGKLWVAEMADYPRGVDDKGKPGGRIRFLEDTNGDGKYDKSTLFLENVPFPNGVLSWKKGVLVSAAPDIFYAEDTNGDGKADVKKVLFTGFAEGNQQHRVNGFSRGLDNWIYLANGDSGGVVKVVGFDSPEGKAKTIDIRSRDVRIRPDMGEIETVAGQSQFGRNRDDWGNWFGNNNSRPMWHYVLDDHYLARNSYLIAPNLQRDVSVAPGAAPVFPSSRTLTRFNDFQTANRFTSACSSMVYRDVLIGNDASGTAGRQAQVFISEPVHNLVHREVMESNGFSFTSRRAVNEERSEFLSSTDNWFRPTQLKTGPDGALYVADMYRLVIEHPQWIPIEWQRKLDLRAGHDKGRIWRVAPINAKLRSIPRLDSMTTDELVQALNSPNGWQRDLAQQLLIDRADPTSIGLLVRQAMVLAVAADSRDSRPDALGRLHVLCTLDGLMSVPALHASAREALSKVLPVALCDSDPGVRRHAIRICEAFPNPTTDLWTRLAGLVNDTDSQVQLQLAYTLGDISHPDAGSILGKLATRSNGDGLLVTAVLSSLNKGNLQFVLAEVMKYGEQTELLQQLLSQATALNHEPSLVALLSRATEPVTPGPNEETLPSEQRVLPGGFTRWQYSAVDQFLIALDRKFTTLEQWLSGLSAEAKPLGQRLQTLFSAARTLSVNESVDPKDRIAAVRVLARSGNSSDEMSALYDLITPRQPPELQSAALATLARLRSPEIAKTLLSSYRSFAPSLRIQACEVLLGRDAWRDELLAALEQKKLSPSDLDATTRQRLLDHKSKGVAERAAKLLAVDLNSDRAKVVAEYLPAVRTSGDFQHGSQLFKKMCSQCHKLGDLGHAVGPDLASLTDKTPDALITAILDPNRAVETKFLTYNAITKSGVTHSGLLATETAASVTLKTAEGKEITLLRTEIEEIQSTTKSLMPEGLERELKPADAAALIAYIRLNVPLPASKKFPGNEPRVVASAADGKFTLTPFDAEIYGSTIVIEEQHKNLGWWSSADDHVVWTIRVPSSGQYTVRWTYACEPAAAGSRVTVEAGGRSLTQRVEPTASWDDYRTVTLGDIELPAGEVRLTMKPASRPLPALADVRFVTLDKK